MLFHWQHLYFYIASWRNVEAKFPIVCQGTPHVLDRQEPLSLQKEKRVVEWLHSKPKQEKINTSEANSKSLEQMFMQIFSFSEFHEFFQVQNLKKYGFE